MGLLGNFAAGMRSLFGRERTEIEMDEELRGFLHTSTRR